MFCAFIFVVLLLKYCFPIGNQLKRYCASDIFTVAKPHKFCANTCNNKQVMSDKLNLKWRPPLS